MNKPTAEEIIKKHLEGWQGMEKLSLSNFAETGIVSGSLKLALKAMLEEAQNEVERYKEALKDSQQLLEQILAYRKYTQTEGNVFLESQIEINKKLINIKDDQDEKPFA